MSAPDKIRAILYQENGVWVAQCLEYDIYAQASDVETVHRRILAAIRADYDCSMEIHGEAFRGIEPAPARFHEMWEERDDGDADETAAVPDGPPVSVSMAYARAA